jgi:dolichol-phosphate mannosyltransferase
MEQHRSGEVDLGIVVPAFNEEANLPTLVRELATTLEPAGIQYELVLVDDGSRDGTRGVIRALCRENPTVRGLLLSRNFGHQPAVSIGLQHVRGKAIAVMDADLQDRPSDLMELYECWRREGADVVYAVRQGRKENIFKRSAYALFYRILGKLANIEIPLDSGDFCVMGRSFVDRLNALPERQRFVRGLRAWLGGRQIGHAVTRGERFAGESQYTLGALMRLAGDGLVSFSHLPLRIASWVGVASAVLAFLGAVTVLVWRFTGMLPEGAGLATIALGVLFLGGIQLLTIGILGEYIGRIFDEVKSRPVAVVHELLECGGGTPPDHGGERTPAECSKPAP